jgi:hypothetical protein
MAPLHSRDGRTTTVLAGVVSAAATLLCVAASSITPTTDSPGLLAAALAYVAVGTGVVATVSLFLFTGRALLSPALVGGGYLAVVYSGFLVTGGNPALEALLSRWPWAFAAALGLGLVEYLLRRGLSGRAPGDPSLHA